MPHDPRNPPESYRQTYYDNPPPLPENFLPQHPFDNGQISRGGRDEGLADWPRQPDVIRDQLCEYYGLITHLDGQIGRILDAIDEHGFGENTVVVYSADHGLALGSHGLLGKQNVYEHSMRCPLVVRGPGIPANTSTMAMTYLLDLYRTFVVMQKLMCQRALMVTIFARSLKGVRNQCETLFFWPIRIK